MFMAGLFAGSIAHQIIGLQAKLSSKKLRYFLRDHFPGRKQAAWKTQGAELQSKAKTIVRTASCLNVFEVIIGQCVVAKQRGFVSWNIE